MTPDKEKRNKVCVALEWPFGTEREGDDEE